jgi:hypothetical protein
MFPLSRFFFGLTSPEVSGFYSFTLPANGFALDADTNKKKW